MNYTLKRRAALAEAGTQHGGLHRKPYDLPVYRVLVENEAARDWGSHIRASKICKLIIDGRRAIRQVV